MVCCQRQGLLAPQEGKDASGEAALCKSDMQPEGYWDSWREKENYLLVFSFLL